MKLPFFGKRAPVTFCQRLLAALDQVERADKVHFVSLGEGFYVYVMPPVYDFVEQREQFNRDADEARKAVMGDVPLGRYTLINFRDVREGKDPFSDDYQKWGGKHAVKLTGEIGLIFMVMADEVRQVITQECERAGLKCEPYRAWDMRVTGGAQPRTIYTGDLVYEVIGRAVDLSELVREYLAGV